MQVTSLGIWSPVGPKKWNFKEVEEIDSVSYDLAQSDQKKLWKFANGDLLPYVRFATEEYRAAYSEASDAGPHSPDRERLGLAIKFAVLTYVSALCMQKEQTDTKIHRIREQRWGKEFARSSKPLGSVCYDSSFAYRFCVRLRNFMLHESADIVEVSLIKSRAEEPYLRVCVDREVLLNRELENKWSTVRQEIELLDDKIDLTPLIIESSAVAEYLTARARLLLFPGITLSLKRMRQWKEKLGEMPSGSTPVMLRTTDDDDDDDEERHDHDLLTLQVLMLDQIAEMIRASRKIA